MSSSIFITLFFDPQNEYLGLLKSNEKTHCIVLLQHIFLFLIHVKVRVSYVIFMSSRWEAIPV